MRGLVFTHEAMRDWEAKLAPLLTEGLRKRRNGKAGRCWYVDETYIKVAGAVVLSVPGDRPRRQPGRRLSRAKPAIRPPPRRSSAPPCRSPVEPEQVTTDEHASYPAGPRRGLLR